VVNPHPFLSLKREIELSSLLVLLTIGKYQPVYHQLFITSVQTVLVNFRLRFPSRRCKMKPTSGARPMLLAGVQADVSISANQISSVPHQKAGKFVFVANRIDRHSCCPYVILPGPRPLSSAVRSLVVFLFLSSFQEQKAKSEQQMFRRKDAQLPARFFLQPLNFVLGAVDAGYARVVSLFCCGCRSSGAA
jgi:hypothetical protein